MRKILLPLASTVAVIAVASVGSVVPLAAQAAADPIVLDSTLLSEFRWRNIGPDRGGRSIAATGVRGRPGEAYFGATGGGLWKTTNGGEDWFPVTDGWITSASVGAVAVSETDPDVVFIGTGETCIRGNIMPGDGVYRSRDGGRTWEHVGFRESHGISKIRIHPTNPNVIFVASFGKYGGPSEERGVYKSTDGGDTWRRVLFRNDETGAIDISIDRNDPDVMYAALWEAYRKEYQMSSGGPGSGLFKSTDGGETWTEITRNPGLPQEGVVGRIGVSVSRANSNRVYALVENDDGGLFSSDDAGETWELVNGDRSIRQRAFYYTHVFADPHDEDVVYIQNTGLYRSEDGGRTTESIGGGTHGDHHDFWIDPDDAAHLVVGNDGGGAVSTSTGDDWTDQEYPTAQFYHVITTPHIPFHVCGSQQDNSTLCTPSDWNLGAFSRMERDSGYVELTAGSTDRSYRAGGGEPGYIAPDPKRPDLFYSGTNNGRYLDKYDRRLGTSREVNPYPWFYSGEPSSALVERWQWTFPIIFSKVDPSRLYVSSQRLWMTTDGGDNWTALSDDLTRADPSTLGPSGGPITGDMNGPEVYATIFAVGPSKLDVDVIWVGSDDGLVHVTRDGGGTWTDITPPDMPEFGRVSQIDASAFDVGTAYVSVRRPLLNDLGPYIWKTDDFGETWTKIVSGIREDAYVHTIREDPQRRGLLYAGTQHGVYISFDDGGQWQELNEGLPDVPIADLIVEETSLVIGTHGRSFWVLDDIAPLRQMTADLTSREAVMFTPPPGVRSGRGVRLSWWLADEPSFARLEILDGSGMIVRAFEADTATAESDEGQRGGRFSRRQSVPLAAGLTEMEWDLTGEPFTSFDGMILWGVRRRAPTLPPGRYTARLTTDEHTVEAPVEIVRNPWIDGVTDADLQAQYEFSRSIWEKVNEANQTVIEIRRVKAQLEDRLEASDDERLAEAARALDENASEVEANIYQVRNRSGQDPLNFPIKVNNRLANLMSMAEQGDGRPGNNMPEIFQILVDELRGYTDRLEQVWATDLAAVNRELERLGLDPISPACEPGEACQTA